MVCSLPFFQGTRLKKIDMPDFPTIHPHLYLHISLVPHHLITSCIRTINPPNFHPCSISARFGTAATLHSSPREERGKDVVEPCH